MISGSRRRDITRTDGAGGEFVPPLWLVDLYAPFLRAGRTAANLCQHLDLPPGTDTLNVPLITTGAATAIQTGDNQTVAETDLVTSSAVAPVRTIAGQEDVAVQLVDQSALSAGLDQMIFKELLQDYNKQLDAQIINGSGSAGQIKGILNATGIVSVTYTQASPTQITHYPVIGQIASQVARQRFLPATGILMRPERWYWWESGLDSSNRPYFAPSYNGPYNAQATSRSPARPRASPVTCTGCPCSSTRMCRTTSAARPTKTG